MRDVVVRSVPLGRLWRGGVQLAALADPTPAVAAGVLRGPPPELRLISIYRRRNSANVRRLIAPVLDAGGAVRLWALDERDPALEEWTAGCGPGSRFALANALLAGTAPCWTVLADDDVRFSSGDAGRLAAFARRLGLDISQPAHALGSHVSHSFTRRAPFRVARLTSFVEIGPVVAFSPRALPHVLPLPESGMGWGTEAAWAALRDGAGLQLGIVDSVTLRHLGAIGGSYASERELDSAFALLAERGLRDWSALQRTWRNVFLWNLAGTVGSDA